MKLNLLTKLALVTLAGAALTTSAYAQGVLLTVDLSNPTNVIITATGNNAAVNDNSTPAWEGVSLLSFLTSAVAKTDTYAGSLTGGGVAYNAYFCQTGGNSPGNDLCLYNYGVGDPQTFSTGAPAFTGTATLNLSSIAGSLPSAGASGNIYTSYSGNHRVLLGQWQVMDAAPTPEPGTLALAGLGGVGAWFCARRRK